MSDQFIYINGKTFSLEKVAAALGVPDKPKPYDFYLCQPVESGVLRAGFNDFGGAHPGIEVDLDLPLDKCSMPIMISRTEQSKTEGDGHVRTYNYWRDNQYFMFFDADTRPDLDADKVLVHPSVTVSGSPVYEVEVNPENPYVRFTDFSHQSIAVPLRQTDEDLLRDNMENCRSFVSEQIYLLMDTGWIDSNQQIHADIHLDEITREYLLRCDEWEKSNPGVELPLSMEMDFMHKEILKVARQITEQKEEASHLHETELYKNALAHFSGTAGNDIENDFIREHAAELICCYENSKDLLDFDFWTHYETLLGDKLTWDEYVALDEMYGEDPLDIKETDTTAIACLRADLESYRNKPESLADKIIEAQDKAGQQTGQQHTQAPELSY